MTRMLGKYEIIRTLGQGAMGEVYLAQQPAIGREVAIKTILPSAAKGEDAEDRFRREAMAAGRLNHPNLVTIYDFEKDGEVLFLVMEFVKGQDLAELITKQALSQPQFLEVLAQVCDGLGFAHRNGIIHRDIKPANVRVTQDGKRLLTKVMDFGIARVEDSSMTATGIVMGTVSYMAPEYIRTGKATAQSDLFAVGVMLYECLAGCKPFAGDTTTTVLFKIVSEEHQPIDPSAIHGISPSIRAVLDRALAKDPAQRFQCGEDLARALRACMDPTWSGTVEEATARISTRELELAEQEAEAAAARSAAATKLVPGPGPSQPTQMLSSAADPTAVLQAAPAPGRPSRTGLYAAVGALLLALAAGGAWRARSHKGTEAPVPSAPTDSAPAGPTPGETPTPGAAVSAPPSPGVGSVTRPGPAPTAGPSAPPATPSAATAPVVQPQAKPEPPRPEAPKPAEESFDQKLAKAEAQLSSDPQGAAASLKTLVQAQPAHASAQGLYLAALLKTRRAAEFERGFQGAKAAGIGIKALLGVGPFKEALKAESRAQRAKDGSNVLAPEVMAKVTEGL
jgi:serine/threonine-protein kinase